jgi:hypothetical protein
VIRQSERPDSAAPIFVSQPGSGVGAHYDHGRPRLELSGHPAGAGTDDFSRESLLGGWWVGTTVR